MSLSSCAARSGKRLSRKETTHPAPAARAPGRLRPEQGFRFDRARLSTARIGCCSSCCPCWPSSPACCATPWGIGGRRSAACLLLFDSEYQTLAPDALANLLIFVCDAFFGPQTLRYLPVVLLPFIFALQAAANYLDDIFELGRVDIARDFILQVALTGNRKHIRIREGQIHPDDMDSPIYRIGGPGQVEVELDSVALFEKLDGRPSISARP